MKNLLFIVCFTFSLSLISPLAIEAQYMDFYLQGSYIRPRKSNKEKIRLEARYERKSAKSLPNISLYKSDGRLESSITKNSRALTVQIIDNNQQVIHESVISPFQEEWLLNIDFLQSNYLYQIKFYISSGEYLSGYFKK